MTKFNSSIGIVNYSKWNGADIDTKEISVTVVERILPPQNVDVLIIALDQRQQTSSKSKLELIKSMQIDVALSLKMGIVFGCNIGNTDVSNTFVPTKEFPAIAKENPLPEDHYWKHRFAAQRLLHASEEEQLRIKTFIAEKLSRGAISLLNVPHKTTDERVLVVSCTDTVEDLKLLKQALQHSTAGIIVLIGHGNEHRVGSFHADEICEVTKQLSARCVVLGSCCGGEVAKVCARKLPAVLFLGYPTVINVVVPYAGLVEYLCIYYVLLSVGAVKSIDDYGLSSPKLWGSGGVYCVPPLTCFYVLYKVANEQHTLTFPKDVVRLETCVGIPNSYRKPPLDWHLYFKEE